MLDVDQIQESQVWQLDSTGGKVEFRARHTCIPVKLPKPQVCSEHVNIKALQDTMSLVVLANRGIMLMRIIRL